MRIPSWIRGGAGVLGALGLLGVLGSLGGLAGIGCKAPVEPAPAASAPRPGVSASAVVDAGASAGSAAAALPEPPARWDRYIQSVSVQPGGNTLLLWCSHFCIPSRSNGAPIDEAVVFLWRPGEEVVREVHFGPVDAAASYQWELSASGKTLLGNTTSELRVLTPEGALLHSVAMSALYGNALLSPDETRILAASVLGEVRLLERATGRVLHKSQAHSPMTGAEVAIAWSPDGERAVVQSHRDSPFLIDGKTGRKIATLAVKGESFEGQPALRFLGGGERLLVATEAGTVASFDGRTGKLKEVLRGPRKEAGSALDVEVGAAVSEDGRRLAVAGPRGDVAWIELETKKLTEISVADGEVAGSPSWTPDGKTLVFQKGAGVRAVRVETGAAVIRLPGEWLLGVAASGMVIAKGGSREILGIEGERVAWRAELPGEPLDLVMGPERKWLLVSDGFLEMIRLRDGKRLSFALQATARGPRLVAVATSAAEAAAVLAAP